jgi:hypothetical protein
MMTALIARTVVVAAYMVATLVHQPMRLTSALAASAVLAVWTVALVRDWSRSRKPFRMFPWTTRHTPGRPQRPA